MATGAGAALVLDFVAYVRANKLLPVRGVTVCYSSSSLPLLQFVTNTLMAERNVGIEIRTALTRHLDLKVTKVHNSTLHCGNHCTSDDRVSGRVSQ